MALTNAQIKARIKKNWRDSQWGLMDCDRCHLRIASHPCDYCGRWKDLIVSFRRGHRVRHKRRNRRGS